MVVGGGVSGIQASLDLATAGFKVYLVEKAPSIGGHMAQLGQDLSHQRLLHVNTFAKLVEVGRHPNIEVLTYTEVIAWRESR
jgi:heterodisulfide reductase subunit A